MAAKINLKEKIISTAIEFEQLALSLSSNNKRIVFTNGCFDILHVGHVDYLNQAAGYGDILVVGLNTDKSIQQLKGENRPIQDQYSRSFTLAALSSVDFVILFDEQTPYKLIEKIQPNVLIKGSDYKPENIVGYDIVKQNNGEIITIDFIEGYSTSKIIDKIIDNTDN